MAAWRNKPAPTAIPITADSQNGEIFCIAFIQFSFFWNSLYETIPIAISNPATIKPPDSNLSAMVIIVADTMEIIQKSPILSRRMGDFSLIKSGITNPAAMITLIANPMALNT